MSESNGKGSQTRPTNGDAYREGWDRIFGRRYTTSDLLLSTIRRHEKITMARILKRLERNSRVMASIRKERSCPTRSTEKN